MACCDRMLKMALYVMRPLSPATLCLSPPSLHSSSLPTPSNAIMSSHLFDGPYNRHGLQGRPNSVARPKPATSYANYTSQLPPLNAAGFAYDSNDQEIIIIGNATHEQLMSSANSAYMRIHEENNTFACVHAVCTRTY